jgi:ATP-dependent DNA ligase
VIEMALEMVAQSSARAMPGRGSRPRQHDGVHRRSARPTSIACIHDVPAGADLIYAGKVDHGFDTTSAVNLRERLKPLIRKTQPYTKWVAHKGIWVEPDLLAKIGYRAKSAEGKVCYPFFKGLREISK